MGTTIFFHQKQTNHKSWPIVNGFVNLLVGGTTLAAYYIYPHMVKLFPVSMSSLFRKKFCPSGIIAIKFCSSCHLDKSDGQKPFAGEMGEKLELVVNQFQYLRERSISILEDGYQEAWNP
jgi:hypothetical protein